MIWPEIENKGFNILSICVAISIWGQKENPEKVIEKLLKSQEEKKAQAEKFKDEHTIDLVACKKYNNPH